METKIALARLELALRELGAPIAGAFRPGANAREIRRTLAAEGLAAHVDVVAWWAWHDGADADAPEMVDGPGIYTRGENMLIGPWHMFSLTEALRTRRWHLELYQGDDLLPASWLPIATTGGAGDLCADTAVTGPAPLYVLDHETMFERRPPQFASLAEFAALLVRVVDEGLVVPDTMDAHARMVDFPRLPSDLRRLAIW